MAYILEFAVDGLAGNDRVVHRKLDRYVNIFWGLNGTGKTSLLRILNSALRNETSTLSRVPFKSARVIFWSNQHEAAIERTFDNSEEHPTGEGDDDLSSGSLEPVGEGLWREVPAGIERRWATTVLGDATVPKEEVSFRHTYLPISRLTRPAGGRSYSAALSRSSTIDDSVLDEDFANQVRQKWQSYNTSALLQIRSIQQAGLAAILAQLFGASGGAAADSAAVVPSEQAYEMVRQFLAEQGIAPRFSKRDFLGRYDGETDLRSVVANIQEVTARVDEALRPQHEFQSVIEQLYSGGKKLELGTQRVGRSSVGVEWRGAPIPLQSLSSGEKQLLRLLLETLAADEDTVMIDEPELSMHVDWQRLLVSSMRRVNPDCQLLLATHSPEVMADVADELVFEL